MTLVLQFCNSKYNLYIFLLLGTSARKSAPYWWFDFPLKCYMPVRGMPGDGNSEQIYGHWSPVWCLYPSLYPVFTTPSSRTWYQFNYQCWNMGWSDVWYDHILWYDTWYRKKTFATKSGAWNLQKVVRHTNLSQTEMLFGTKRGYCENCPVFHLWSIRRGVYYKVWIWLIWNLW